MATQSHVSETLRSAVASDRVGHAYLFCGPRGVGKTTLARVLAMALNCPDRGEDGEPCGVCESCDRIWGGHTALDVVEIDAASNRGVEDARDLRERAMYAPSADGRTKVYIVDEAHMLTREAWNALLKILEEPPPRVIFVFATTEPHKIQQMAAPILSRCQRFDFRRIAVDDIVSRLAGVLGTEGGDAPEEALRLIARKADGGMRDALSLLDQVLSLGGGAIDVESVRRVLGLVEEERYLELLQVLRDGRHDHVFVLVESLVDDGYDLVEFYYGLLDILRALLRLRLSPDAPVELRADVRDALTELADAFAPGDLVRMLTSAAELESQGSLRRSPNPRLPIEMLLLRMSYIDRTVGLEELLAALGGAPVPTGGAGTAGGGGGEGHAAPSEDAPATPAEAPTLDLASNGRDTGPISAPPVAPPTPDADPAPPPAESPPPPTSDPLVAWDRWLDSGVGVPKGLSAFLRACQLAVREDGALLVRPTPGPAHERISSPQVLTEVRAAVNGQLSSPIEVLVEAAGEVPEEPVRVTPDEVKADTLSALFRQEPRLKAAVEELDLELME